VLLNQAEDPVRRGKMRVQLDGVVALFQCGIEILVACVGWTAISCVLAGLTSETSCKQRG